MFIILTLILPGYIYDTETVVPSSEDYDIFNIELKLYFGTPTRAPEDYIGKRDENFLGINEKDFKVVVYNGDG